MRILDLSSHIYMHHTGNTPPVDVGVATALTAVAHENGKIAILCGLMIEREIEAIIGSYLHPDKPELAGQREFVAEMLGSDVVTFRHKLRLITSLVEKKEVAPEF